MKSARKKAETVEKPCISPDMYRSSSPGQLSFKVISENENTNVLWLREVETCSGESIGESARAE